MASSSSKLFLSGKCAIITGGSGTIGRAISGALLSTGANVVITGRSLDRLNKAKDYLMDSFGGKSTATVSIFSGDVTDESCVTDLFNFADETYGGCDLLVNNAGISTQRSTFDVSGNEFSKIMNINVVGPFIYAKEALKKMKEKGSGGRIINIGSLSAISPRPHSAPYTTSKFALLGLTQSLSLDARPYGIAVGIIHPGNVISDLLSQETIEERGKTEGFIEPEDVANCVVTMANMPYSSNVFELTIMPTRQPFVGRG